MNELVSLLHEVVAKDVAWPLLPILMANLETGRIVYCTTYAAALFGYDRKELIGQPVEVLVPGAHREAHAGWCREMKAPELRLMGSGRPVIGVKKDGQTFPAHVGLTRVEVDGHWVGVALVADLTGAVEMVTEGMSSRVAKEVARLVQSSYKDPAASSRPGSDKEQRPDTATSGGRQGGEGADPGP